MGVKSAKGWKGAGKIVEVLGRVGRIWGKFKGRRTKLFGSPRRYEGTRRKDLGKKNVKLRASSCLRGKNLICG